LNPSGYAWARDPALGRNDVVSRIVWRAIHGPIPAGMCVLHRCDVRCCINPAHLFLGTNHDNVKDKVAKGRHHRGEQAMRSVLTEQQVLEARALNAQGLGYRKLARRFGVHRTTIKALIQRKSWAHI